MNTEKLQLRHALLQIWNTSTSAQSNPSLKQSHKSSLIEYETFGNPGHYTACVTVKLPTYAPVFPSTGKFNSKIKAERNAAKIALSWITKKQHEGDDIKETEVLKGMQAICLDDDDNLTKNTKLKQAQKIVKKLKPQTDPHEITTFNACCHQLRGMYVNIHDYIDAEKHNREVRVFATLKELRKDIKGYRKSFPKTDAKAEGYKILMQRIFSQG